MASFNLVPNQYNPIVECFDLELPQETNPKFTINEGYTTSDNYKRYTGRPYGRATAQGDYFTNIMHNNIMPLLVSHPHFRWSWPISLQTLIETTQIKVTLFKDEIGWWQGKHEDPRIFAVSGVVHLQDCNQGTTFTQDGYQAPTKKGTGAFWANCQWSHHEVPVVTAERMGYLVIAQWKFLDFAK